MTNRTDFQVIRNALEKSIKVLQYLNDEIDTELLCVKAIFELERIEEAQKWQPIETAPKDGHWILIWYPSSLPRMVAWMSHPSIGHGWYEGKKFIAPEVPTHWRPLPVPPEQGE